MTEVSRQAAAEHIADLLGGDIYATFREVFINTCRITGEIPVQPANEIRNAMDHMAQALHARDGSSSARNLTNAHAHLVMATVDCLAISVSRRVELLTTYITVIEDDEGVVHAPLRERLVYIRSRQREIFPNIRFGSLPALHALSDSLAKLLIDCNQLYEAVLSNTAIGRVVKERARKIWEREGRPRGRDSEHWRQAEDEISELNRQKL